MEPLTSLKSLIVSRTRLKLLQVFCNDPRKMFYIRDLTRRTGEEINSVRRELINLKKAGILGSEWRANRLFFWIDKQNYFFSDLLSLIHKTIGIGGEIIKNQQRLGKIKFVVFSGKFIRRLPPKNSEIDILIIGQVVLPELGILIREEEKKIGREINYTVMESEEFSFRKKNKDPFLMQILMADRITVIGDNQEIDNF